uniref:C-type lectin domain-containing protein n=1 Tax=Acrobeloides nanus TaxID=290746 RepID=A0A914C591_9BILA
MQNYTNVKYLIDFILNNFTNKLPFNDPNFNIALLSYGTINGSRMFGPFKNYEDFSSVVYQQWDISQKYKLQKASLNETLWKYWDYITDGQEVENLKCSEDTYCLHKLVLFTAINDNATLTDAFDIASKINNHSFVIAVGINLTHSITLIDIGRRVYNIFFDDFYLWKETPLDLYLQDVLCKMNIKTPKQVSCGKGYCESILCGYLYDNKILRCQYFTGCILNKCYYWRHSTRKWSTALKYCEIINSTLVTINDEKVQEGIYGIVGDYEYWIGLHSALYVNPIWTWSDPSQMLLSDTNYTNWANDQPDTNNGMNFCVSDTNSSELIQNWKVLSCASSSNERIFLCERETTIPYDPEPKNHNKLIIILSVGAGLVFIVIFSILIIGLNHMRQLTEFERYQATRHKQRQQP